MIIVATLLFACVYAATISPSLATYFNALLKVIFSPIFAVNKLVWSSIETPSILIANNSSFVEKSLENKASPILFASSINNSFFETKSVSELSSKITATLSLTNALTIPSAAILPAFLAAFKIPFSCNQSIDFSTSLSLASKAFLTSRKPKFVLSLNSLILFKSTDIIYLFF
ncbi:Uncharacterised protein [Chlamydia trachomatis]|nr:Uncharacterised protein [Chlamydia trachomatis]CRH55033.1 Uncharacterised protein [Chlamydia trachomatis]CRH56896.1 Uncharacterised protein [Chlamydia trachomatis]